MSGESSQGVRAAEEQNFPLPGRKRHIGEHYWKSDLRREAAKYTVERNQGDAMVLHALTCDLVAVRTGGTKGVQIRLCDPSQNWSQEARAPPQKRKASDEVNFTQLDCRQWSTILKLARVQL